MPKFTVLLQTSPTSEPGKFVNSLPPVKRPREPLASGDTVPEMWSIEVATLAEVTALLHKQMESLTARVAELEAKLDGREPKGAKEAKHEEAKTESATTEDSEKKERSEAGAEKAARKKTEKGKSARSKDQTENETGREKDPSLRSR